MLQGNIDRSKVSKIERYIALEGWKGESLHERREFEVKDGFEDVTPKEGDNNFDKPAQHLTDEGKNTGQQIAKHVNDIKQDRKNFVLDIKGNAAEDTLNELNDDLVDTSDQLGPPRTRENGNRP